MQVTAFDLCYKLVRNFRVGEYPPLAREISSFYCTGIVQPGARADEIVPIQSGWAGIAWELESGEGL
ncbi:MAG: hypothetical protein N0E54_03580 [Candidatus Thiodiazotropha taylori]|nr:hypothetical protein [Candidatus Thiodiazotropha endolucinida]MCW4227810.1 hypothetical protein [Candidatus Thiodiazotropha taylori]